MCGFRELLRRCLKNNPKRRWQAVGDLRAELETISAAPRAVPLPIQAHRTLRPLWKRAIANPGEYSLFSAFSQLSPRGH